MRKAISLLAIALFAFSAPARAESLQEKFEVRLLGVPVGELVVAVNSNSSAYAAKSYFRTTGAVGVVVPVHFTMTARGAGQMPDYSSQSYNDEISVGSKLSTASYRFSNGDDRIDPLTGILAALADRPLAAGCGFERDTYDGVRTLRVAIREGSRKADGALSCSGAAIRLAGYTEADLKEARQFPFTVQFAPQGDRLVAVRGDVGTIFGKVSLRRK